MKLYRLYGFSGYENAYIEYTTSGLDFWKKIISGKKIKRYNPSITLKNVTKNFPDCMAASGFCETFVNDKFKSLLQKFIPEEKIDFIKVKHTFRGNQYYLLNLLEIKKCMDYNNSEYTTYENKKIDKITNLVTLPNTISKYDIFRLKEHPYNIFISEELKNEIENEKITGIRIEDSMDLTLG